VGAALVSVGEVVGETVGETVGEIVGEAVGETLGEPAHHHPQKIVLRSFTH